MKKIRINADQIILRKHALEFLEENFLKLEYIKLYGYTSKNKYKEYVKEYRKTLQALKFKSSIYYRTSKVFSVNYICF